jgi:hypothetical protein
MYKNTLDRSSKKFQCPSCTKKTFVYYKDNETGAYLETVYGRCDRESKCGYFKTPADNKSIVTPIKEALFMAPTFLNETVINKYCTNYDDNNFINYVLKHFPEEKVYDAIELYYIGTGGPWKGATIFWQIDEHHNIRTGKTMLYDCNTGNRVKKPYPHINWMHKVLQKTPYVLQQCLFGLQLTLNEPQKKTVCIVESEKTAFVMSMILPDYHWMATGSKSNLKQDLLIPIKDFKIILYPDKTEFIDWNNKMKLLIESGFKMKCSNLLEKIDIELGGDLVDLILKDSKVN